MSITSNNYGQTTTTHSSNTPKVTKDFTLSDLSKMEEQAKQYRGMFTAAGYPMAMTCIIARLIRACLTTTLVSSNMHSRP